MSTLQGAVCASAIMDGSLAEGDSQATVASAPLAPPPKIASEPQTISPNISSDSLATPPKIANDSQTTQILGDSQGGCAQVESLVPSSDSQDLAHKLLVDFQDARNPNKKAAPKPKAVSEKKKDAPKPKAAAKVDAPKKEPRKRKARVDEELSRKTFRVRLADGTSKGFRYTGTNREAVKADAEEFFKRMTP